MAQPAEYTRRKDFTDQDGDDTDHNALNQEFDAAAQSINQIRDNLALIQKDDGSLKNGIVGKDQLAPNAFDDFQQELDDAVERATTAADESTRSALASGEFAAVAESASQSAAQSEENAAASAANAAGAAKALFDGIYLGSLSSDPTVDGNGQPLTDGDFYFNNVAKLIRTWDATSGKWVNATPSGQFKRQKFDAGTDFTPGTTTSLTLASEPQTASNIFVHFDAAFQQPSEYSLSGQTLTFTSPIPVGVQSVAVAYLEAVFVPITNAILSFPDYAAASAASATLPDGQIVDALDVQERYKVQGGVLVFDTSLASVPTPLDYQAKGDGVTNDDAAFSALEINLNGKTIDLLGKTYAVSNKPTGNNYVNGSFAVGKTLLSRDIVTADESIQPMLAYRRKILSFPAVNQYTETIINGGGEYYPNAMAIDDVDDEIYFVTNPPVWVTVYDFHTRAFKTTFKLMNGASEGVSIYREGGRKYLVTRAITGAEDTKAAFYDITDQPAPMSELTATRFSTFSVGHNLTIRAGYLYTTMRGRAKGDVNQRNIIEVWDLRTDKKVGQLVLDPAKTGFQNQEVTSFPKMQGFDVLGGYLLIGNGNGGYNHTTDTVVTPSRMQGFRVLSSDGGVVAECFFDPQRMGAKLQALGYKYQYNECEGIQFAYGRIYSMYALAGKWGSNADKEGFTVFEEMSASPDAIDFSDCAAFVPTGLTRYYSSYYTRWEHNDAATQKLISLYDGSEITKVTQLFEMMYQLQMCSVKIATRGTNLDDGLGGTVPLYGSLFCEAPDNINFYAKFEGYLGNSAGYFVRATRSSSGVYTVSRCNPDWVDGNLTPRTGSTFNLGEYSRPWKHAFVDSVGQSESRGIRWGTGSPQGVVVASTGATYLNIEGGAGSTLWVKESGSGSTGWVSK